MARIYNKKYYKILEKNVLDYFFNNINNDYKTMQKKFKLSKVALDRIISDECERRFTNARKNNENNKTIRK